MQPDLTGAGGDREVPGVEPGALLDPVPRARRAARPSPLGRELPCRVPALPPGARHGPGDTERMIGNRLAG